MIIINNQNRLCHVNIVIELCMYTYSNVLIKKNINILKFASLSPNLCK